MEIIGKEGKEGREKLLNLLQLAESYSILSSELEEDAFKAGVQVEVEDKRQAKHAAEIIELVRDDSESPINAIVALFNEHINMTDFNQTGWFNLSFSTVNKDVQLAANEKIRTGEAPAKYMDIVFGKNSSNGFDNKDLSKIKAKLLEKKYPPNESQMDAIFSGINSRDVFLVMGPPGTGKTTVILEWVKYFVTQEHKRVLVSSQNNKAVDNVLARIADEKDIDIIRIGSESKIQSEVKPYMFENKVKGLRALIIQNSDKRTADIVRIQQIWNRYIALAENAAILSQKADKSHEQFSQVLNGEFLPLYTQLDGALQEYTNIKSEKSVFVGRIKELQEKIDKYEKTSKAKYAKCYMMKMRDCDDPIIFAKRYDSKQKEVKERFSWEPFSVKNEAVREKFGFEDDVPCSTDIAKKYVRQLYSMLTERASKVDLVEEIKRTMECIYPFEEPGVEMGRTSGVIVPVVNISEAAFMKYRSWILNFLIGIHRDGEYLITHERLYGNVISLRTESLFVMDVADLLVQKIEKDGKIGLMKEFRDKFRDYDGKDNVIALIDKELRLKSQ